MVLYNDKNHTIVTGVYLHYKGNHYKVIGVAADHIDGEVIVIYYRCDVNGIYKSIRESFSDLGYNTEVITMQPFVRPMIDFLKEVPIDIDGSTEYIPRFQLIKEHYKIND